MSTWTTSTFGELRRGARFRFPGEDVTNVVTGVTDRYTDKHGTWIVVTSRGGDTGRPHGKSAYLADDPVEVLED
ncbi:hypothetical protein [Streptomyces sp. NPDC015131]|uniref:hypothetical protein n=1 Tax=Streptomyces sp. NPDC015131 TaxID=3364941 RepID=UPI0036FC553A